uniref:FANCI_S1 domain-containing protein n=1 Tax=Glossina austeni TaxID=7395 RepID=A0A1A9VH73_GLOAU
MSSRHVSYVMSELCNRRYLAEFDYFFSLIDMNVCQNKNILNKLSRDKFTKFWHCLLRGFSPDSFDAREKRFVCVKCFLDGLLNVELTYKQTYDLIRRLYPDLQTFSNEHLVEILERCVNHLRVADGKIYCPHAYMCLLTDELP